MDELIQICDGVYSATDIHDEQILHAGMRLQRFMDIFYICCPTEELTPQQVEALCRSRANHPASFMGGANARMRQIFRRFVVLYRPTTLLEVGAGTNPLFAQCEAVQKNISYVQSDADPLYAELNNVFSGSTSKLAFSSGYFDLAIAIFVLHFKFYKEQMLELQRCLNLSGLFIGNIYRRDSASRLTLVKEFERCGFYCELIDDPYRLCQNNQFLIAVKEEKLLTDAVQLFKIGLADVEI